MIYFAADNVTLKGVDAAGKPFSHYFLEGQVYTDMLIVMGQQEQAALDNTATVATYERVITDAEAAFHYDPIPPKPLEKLVSDTGAVSFAAFVPPLRDMLIPTPAPSSGLIAAVVPDKQAIIYNMVLAMFKKMFPGA